MKIRQFPYRHPSYGKMFGYLLYSGNEGVAIDPNPYKEIDRWCADHDITIILITNTHLHTDHTVGNNYFTADKNIPSLKPLAAASQKRIAVGDEHVTVRHVPGHSNDSVVFLAGDILITGDTLFNGTIGNCYTGDYEEYFKSLSWIMELTDTTTVYAAHDLVEYAMGVAKKIEPENRHIDEYLSQYNPSGMSDGRHVKDVKPAAVFSTIAQEKQINPFVRWDDPALDGFRQTLGMPLSTPFERWRAMMSVH